MDNSARINIKMGQLEIEYEGEPNFLKNDLEKLLKSMHELALSVPEVPGTEIKLSVDTDANTTEPITQSSSISHLTTNSIIARLGEQNGPGIVLASMACLQIFNDKQSCTRNQILEEMKSATQYYKESHRSNMSQILAGLVRRKEINQTAKDTYSLHGDKLKEIKAKLAQG